MDIKNRVCIYGAGNNGKKIFHILEKNGIQVLAFLDASKTAPSHYNSTPIINTESDRAKALVNETDQIVVSVFNRTADLRRIDELLKQLCFHQRIQFPTFVRMFSDEFGSAFFWIDSRNTMQKPPSDWNWLSDRLADDLSREVLKKILAFRTTFNPEDLPVSEGISSQYFPLTLKGWLKFDYINLIDCGAFDGDTILPLIQQKRLRNFIAFEPDPANFEKLSKIDFEGAPFLEGGILIPCGVWSACIQLRFSGNEGEGSRIDGNGSNIIQCSSIDSTAVGFKPNFIKMDIEGAEIEALKGAQLCISKYKPNLAIAVYHSPNDLIEIPQLIEKIHPGYRMFLRQHGECALETVLYCL